MPAAISLLLACGLALTACNCAGGGGGGAPSSAGLPPAEPEPEPPRERGEGACASLPFAESIPIAEASGAVYLPARGDGRHAIFVVGDSGTRGAFLRIDAESGEILERGRLPLGEGASDDLEGLSAIGDLLYGVTSSGWMRAWRPGAGGYELTGGPYPIGDREEGEVCADGDRTNCARNYEGLCLRRDASPGRGCAGFVAAKADGVLHCLLLAEDGTLRLDGGRGIGVTHREALTGCHFDPEGDLLWAGTNTFAANSVLRIRGAGEPASAEVELVGALGAGFPEALAVGPGGLVYRFSDTARSPSLVNKYRCR